MVLRIYKNGFIALASGITLGMGETFWGQAVIGDKYAFNTVFVALVVGLALWWAEEREEPHGDKLLYALSLAYGASFLHHRTMILFAPVLAFLVLYHERQEVWRNWRRTLIAMALVILPALIVYPIFLPLIRARNFSPSDWQPQGLGQWVAWMTDRPGLTGTFVAEGFFEQLVDYRLRLVNSYPLVVLIIALFGVAVMAVRQPANVILLLLSYVVQAALAANYRSNYRPFRIFLTLVCAADLCLCFRPQYVVGRAQDALEGVAALGAVEACHRGGVGGGADGGAGGAIYQDISASPAPRLSMAIRLTSGVIHSIRATWALGWLAACVTCLRTRS